MDSMFWVNAPAVVGIIALFISAFFYFRVKSLPDGNETMNRIAGYIREGSMAFLARQYQALAVFGVVVFVDRKSTRLNSSHSTLSRMPSSA